MLHTFETCSIPIFNFQLRNVKNEGKKKRKQRIQSRIRATPSRATQYNSFMLTFDKDTLPGKAYITLSS
ncbi:hypothetical protein T11_12015 [Trichinella zimbabwensis]|uniref:Uncharacterized protein n=1 Tax=Trichinella zimbabwensis TaxID=268475 RepID=A0A0V1H8G5_9BILA|nr:hypothetical protein T11_12015 [Trichinella zimbabwensis]